MKFYKIKANSYLGKVLYILGGESRKLPLMIILFMGVASLDLIGLSLIIPFISVVIEPSFIMESDLYNNPYIALPDKANDLILLISSILLITFIIKAIIGVIVNKKILDFCFRQGYFLRTKLMSYYINIKYEKYVEKNSSEYVYSIENLANQYSQNILQSILRIASEAIIIFMILCFFAFQDFFSLIILLIIVGISIVIYEVFFRRKITGYGLKTNAAQAGLIKGIHEGIDGLKEIRILGSAKFFEDAVDKHSDSYANFYAKYQLIGQIPKYFIESLLLIFMVTVIAINIYIGNTTSQIIPILGMFAFGALRLAPSMNQVLSSLTHLRFGTDALNRLYDDLTDQLESDVEVLNNENVRNVDERFYSLTLENVRFKYNEAKNNTLDSINLNINSGDFIGLVGSSGSGKTTLVDVIMGLFKIDSGKINFNNKDIYQNLESWRQRVAYLPQNVFLTDDSIKNNIALGIEESEIDGVRLMSAIKSSRLDELVSSLPNGIDTEIGEKGIRISGGQRQRIALARAFYFNRDFLILDESTSSLDEKIEKEIVSEINNLKGSKTLLVIAHRVSTLEKCDRIFELSNGKIVNEYSYKSLLGKG
ncbi:MAG: hypothetical protein CMD72_04020 [Gammaproteobacteria bacterium]|nr:hypothetical protein [Gammaproteobacteria bacterium]